MKKFVSWMLALCLMLALGSGLSLAAPETPGEETALSPFGQELMGKYVDPDRVYSTDVRWWLGAAAYTTDTLREEIQALYDGGFRGVELCMQSASNGAPNATYAYCSERDRVTWRWPTRLAV